MGGDARIVTDFEEHTVVLVEMPELGQPGLGIDVHAAELENTELGPVTPDPHLPKEYRPA
nr:hypothetical protein GCM10020092_010490 [Actinoplanes digitatis]